MNMVEVCDRLLTLDEKDLQEFKQTQRGWRLWYFIKVYQLISLTKSTLVTDKEDRFDKFDKLSEKHLELMKKCGDYDDYLQLFVSEFKVDELDRQF